MSHDKGLFVNDLFNGEALGGPSMDTERGMFRSNLFDGEPLGQTTPLPAPATDELISQLATPSTTTPTTTPPAPGGKGGGGAIAPYQPYPPVGGKGGGGSMPQWVAGPTTPATPAAPPVYSGSTSSDFPWVPVLAVGGVAVVGLGVLLAMSGGKKAAAPTANRRVKRNKVRRNKAKRARRSRKH